MTTPANLEFGQENALYTTSNGAPYASPYDVQGVPVDTMGHLVALQDFHHIDLLAHFARERIPERTVHAKGAGAHGTFVATEDASDITCAHVFQKGNITPVTMRFSTVAGESGSADTLRDVHGFAVKFKTQEGNYDMVGIHTPTFFVRDPSKFPAVNHSHKRDPQTNLPSADMFWDFASLNPESIHQFMILFGDRGIPKGLGSMNGYSSHTYKLVNAKGEWVYVKFHYRSNQKYHGAYFTQAEAVRVAGTNPDYNTQDLFDRIDKGDYPSWTVAVQIMTVEQAKKFRYSIFDMTKVWPHKEYPLRTLGKLTLNKNPENYFAEVEQAAFSPSFLVPGIMPSADPMLQSRLFSYPDAQRYRLGVNYQQIPVNAPVVPVANFQRDGFMNVNGNQGSRPNYAASYRPLMYSRTTTTALAQEAPLVNGIVNFLSEVSPLDFEQPRDLWLRVFDDAAKDRFIHNVADHMSNVKKPEIVQRQLAVFHQVHVDIAQRIAHALGIVFTPPGKNA